MKVVALDSHEQFARYADFPEQVYRENPFWVPVDPEHIIHLISGEDDDAEMQVQPFWVEADGQILATVTAIVYERYNKKWNEQTGHFILFEALPSSETAVRALVAEACEWIRSRGCNKVRASMLLGWQLPWTIDAYDKVPTLFHTFNPEYYHGYIKSSGFFTEKGVVQYQVTFTSELRERYRQMLARAEESGVKLRAWDFDRIEEENELFTDLWNETFSNHWGGADISSDRMAQLTVGLKDFLIPDFCVFAEVNGETAGILYAAPDLNQALHSARGKTGDEVEAAVGKALGEIDHGVLLIIGVREGHRNKGVNLGMAAKSYLAMMDRGYKQASYTVVLDDNWPSRRTAEKLGCSVTRNFNVYAKSL